MSLCITSKTHVTLFLPNLLVCLFSFDKTNAYTIFKKVISTPSNTSLDVLCLEYAVNSCAKKGILIYYSVGLGLKGFSRWGNKYGLFYVNNQDN